MQMSEISGEISAPHPCRWITAVTNEHVQNQEGGFEDNLKKHGNRIMLCR